MRQLIIIGSGPAGYTAAVYAARADLKPLMFSGEVAGGQLMNTRVVENWPGTKEGVMGSELMMEMREQAKKFGAEIIDKKVNKVDLEGKVKKIWAGKEVFESRAVIVATGAESIMLGVSGEKEFLGRGVATCAVCDAPFYREKTVYVIGGGDAAAEDALTLTKYAKEIFLVHRRDQLRASKIMAKRVQENPKVKILWNTELKEIIGKEKVEKIRIMNNQTGKEEEMVTDGVFMAIGHKPATEIFKDQLELNEKGYIKTKMSYPGVTTTSVKGVFAAGDVVDWHYQQAVTAAGMGCQAALDAERYLEDKNE